MGQMARIVSYLRHKSWRRLPKAMKSIGMKSLGKPLRGGLEGGEGRF